MKALLFDLWDTLAVSKSFVKNLQKTICADIPLKEFHKRLAYSCFVRTFPDYTCLSKAIFKEFGKKQTQEELNKLVESLESCFFSAELFPDTKYIWKLKETYKFALITNTISTNFNELLESLDLENKFDTISTSFTTNSIKPQKEIYTTALRKLKVKPEDGILISDSIIDLDGGISLDINPLLIDRKNKKNYSPKIKTLKDLPKYLEGFEWK